jgi:hypothetical protein
MAESLTAKSEYSDSENGRTRKSGAIIIAPLFRVLLMLFPLIVMGKLDNYAAFRGTMTKRARRLIGSPLNRRTCPNRVCFAL